MKGIVVKKCKLGLGVFANKDFKKGDKIFRFKGKIVTSKELPNEFKNDRNILVDPLQIGENKFLIIDPPGLYVNHSCDPNSGFKGLTLFAIKDIKKEDEINYDYSSMWFEGMECNCGSPNCRHYIGSFLTLSDQTKSKYKKLGILPKFILNKS